MHKVKIDLFMVVDLLEKACEEYTLRNRDVVCTCIRDGFSKHISCTSTDDGIVTIDDEHYQHIADMHDRAIENGEIFIRFGKEFFQDNIDDFVQIAFFVGLYMMYRRMMQK